ncbi:MAG: hypothetical protein KTR32_18515 [Granulosicoccus sp.]|nr:hypothetical protein [Granulosicoccus sp.]
MTSTPNELSPGQYFHDDLSVGAFYQTGCITIAEAHIVNFAGMSGDFFDVHMDDAFAQQLGFPKRIAHGLLGLCLIDGLKNRADVQLKAVASLGWKEWTFHKPLFIGDSIWATISVETMRLTSKGDRGIVELGFDVQNQKNEQVQSGSNVLLMRRLEPDNQSKSSVFQTPPSFAE